MVKKYLTIAAALTVCAGTSLASTYYWYNGAFNAPANAAPATWYTSEDNTNTASSVWTGPLVWDSIKTAFTDGTAIIDKKYDAAASSSTQYAFGISTINIDTWNDTVGEAANAWHMYTNSANTNLTMKNLNKSSASTLIIRTASSTTGMSLNVTEAITLSGGSLKIGTNNDFANVTAVGQDGYGVANANINSISISNGAKATFALCSLADFGTVTVDSGYFAVLGGIETNSATPSFISPTVDVINMKRGANVYFGMNNATPTVQLNKLDIATINVSDTVTTGDGVLAINAADLNITNFNMQNSGSVSLDFRVPTSDTVNIENLNFTNTVTSDAKLTFKSGGNGYKVSNLTTEGTGALGGQLVVNGTLDIATATHNGTAGANVYAFRASGAGTLNVDSVTIAEGAQIGYGWYEGNNHTRIKNLNLGDVNITAGKLIANVETMFTTKEGTTFTVSGQNSYADILAGVGTNVTTGNLHGAVVVADGGDFTIRRAGGLPNIIMSDLTLTASESTANKGSKAQIASGYQYRVNSVALNNLNFNYAGSATAKQSTFTSYTTAAVDNSDIGAETTVITNLLVDTNADGKVIFGQNSAIGGITVNAGGRLTFNTYQKTTAGVDTSYTATVRGNYVNNGSYLSLDANSKLSISGDLINNAFVVPPVGAPTGLSMFIGNNAGTSFTVVGQFKNNGVVEVNSGMASGASASMSVGGITSDYVAGRTEERRIATNYAGGAMTINLTGAGNYIYTNRILDFGKGTTDLTGLTGTIGIVKNGTGTQYLGGYTYYRGDTIVNSGALYIHADGADNALGLGVAAVVLNGGRFGACGWATSSTEVTAIGTVKTTSLTWDSSAVIAVDLGAGATSDLIAISGAFSKAAGDSEGDSYVFDFSGDVLSISQDAEYKIISWDDMSSVDFAVTDFGYTYDGSSTSELAGYFTMKNDGLYFTQVVPEPAAFAAIFGALALGFAAYRRKRK